MVDIAPFAAVRYSAAKVGNISDVIAPPYDVINAELQDKLYNRHPNNIIRIDLTKAGANEHEDAKYDRAKSTLEEWLKSGVLVREDAPAFYVLEQAFTGPDGVKRLRTGFFMRALLTPWDDGPILPHERTLRGPKIDRLKLMRATHHNLSPIFGTYYDKQQRVLSALHEVKREAPIAEATMDGVDNRMWRIDFAAQHERIISALSGEKLYIADGHHRYETGLVYRDERRDEAAKAGKPTGTPPGLGGWMKTPGFESILMFASALDDPGMVIFPTHRLVHSLPGLDEAQLFEKLAPFFERTPAPADTNDAKRALDEAGHRGNAYLAVTKQGRHLLVAKRSAPWESVPSLPAHQTLRELDVGVLHAVVLEHVLGISPEAQATQANLRYSKDFKEAIESPNKEESVQIAFLMNPTKIEEVVRVAEAGLVMPQKSTFFYPKIPSGLVMYPLD